MLPDKGLFNHDFTDIQSKTSFTGSLSDLPFFLKTSC